DLVAACLTLPRESVLAVVYGLYAFDAVDVKPATSVPRLRKRPREATQEMEIAETTNPRIESPFAPDPPQRPRTGVTNVGPPPAPPAAPPLAGPEGPRRDPHPPPGPRAAPPAAAVAPPCPEGARHGPSPPAVADRTERARHRPAGAADRPARRGKSPDAARR